MNSINVILTIIALVSLAVDPTPSPNTTTTTQWPSTTTEASFYDDINVTAMNLTDDIYIDPILADSDLDDNVINAIIILIFGLVIDLFNLCSNIVTLIGLYKRVASYVKFGLVVGVITVTVAFVLTVGNIIAAPSVASLATLLYFVIAVYLLLVIRSAYYDMLEIEVIQPIYTFGPSGGKEAYQDI